MKNMMRMFIFKGVVWFIALATRRFAVAVMAGMWEVLAAERRRVRADGDAEAKRRDREATSLGFEFAECGNLVVEGFGVRLDDSPVQRVLKAIAARLAERMVDVVSLGVLDGLNRAVAECEMQKRNRMHALADGPPSRVNVQALRQAHRRLAQLHPELSEHLGVPARERTRRLLVVRSTARSVLAEALRFTWKRRAVRGASELAESR